MAEIRNNQVELVLRQFDYVARTIKRGQRRARYRMWLSDTYSLWRRVYHMQMDIAPWNTVYSRLSNT